MTALDNKSQKIAENPALIQDMIGGSIDYVYGQTATLIKKPAVSGNFKKRYLKLYCENKNFRIMLGDFSARTFTGNASTDKLTVTGHEYENGAGPFRVSNSGGALPSGLSASTNYWIVLNTDNTVSLATSKANALAGTKVDFSDAGTGTHTIGGYQPVPAASTTSGEGSWGMVQGQEKLIDSVEKVTVFGSAADAYLNFFWL